jgi:hypothetical protein
VRRGVVAGPFPLWAAAGGCGDRGSTGADRVVGAEVLLRRARLSPADLRRADAGADGPAPQGQPAAARSVGEDRLGVGRPAWRAAGERRGCTDQSLDAAAAVTGCARAAGELGAGVGIDDFAVRKGQTYSTIVIDMETHQPIDVLADREAETVQRWLAGHPEVEIICRDRAGAYASGAAGDPGRRSVPSLAEPRRGGGQDRVRPPRLPCRTRRRRGHGGRSGCVHVGAFAAMIRDLRGD